MNIASSFANTQAGNSLLNTAIGKLEAALKSTFRLATATGDDILISKIQLQNLDNKTITLSNTAAANLYGGYMLNDLDLAGKVVQIQTSPYLYPNQKTSIYIYTKLPYTSTLTEGYIYLGDNTATGTNAAAAQKHEWTETPLRLSANALPVVLANGEWALSDPGKTSQVKLSTVRFMILIIRSC